MVCYLIRKLFLQFLVPEFLKLVKFPIRRKGYFQPFLPEIRISQHCKLAAAASSFRIAKYYYTADYISKENKVLDELSDLAKGQSTLVLVTILEDNQTTKNISQTKERRHFPKAPYFQQDELFHRDDNAVSLEFDVLHKFWQQQKHWNLWHIFCISLISDTFITTNQKHVQKQSNGKKKFAK